MEELIGIVVAIFFFAFIASVVITAGFFLLMAALAVGAVFGVCWIIYRLYAKQRDKALREEREEEARREAREREEDAEARRSQLMKQWMEAFSLAVVQTKPPKTTGMFYVPYVETLPNPGAVVDTLMAPFFRYREVAGDDAINAYLSNVRKVSRQKYSDDQISKGNVISPLDYKGLDIFERYLDGTELSQFVQNKFVGMDLPASLRNQHGIIIGNRGSGKTQMLETLILADIKSDHAPAVFVIDSKNDMIGRIAKLDIFNHVDGARRDEIVIIDFEDRPSLGVLDYAGTLDNRRIVQIIDGMEYFFSAFFEQDLSGHMSVLFSSLMQVALHIPNPTLYHLQTLLDNPVAYPEALAQVEEGTRRFITGTLINARETVDAAYAPTRNALKVRLASILTDPIFAALFNTPKNMVDVQNAMERGAVVLINTDTDALGEKRSALMGKFWIAQIRTAALARGSRHDPSRRKVHIYLDECQPYVDEKLTKMCNTLRSYDVGLMMAFQDTQQMGRQTRVLRGATAIKLASNPKHDDLEEVAGFMGVDEAFMRAQMPTKTHGRFLLHYDGLPKAVSAFFPFGTVDREPSMSTGQYEHLRARNAAALRHTPVVLLPAPQQPAEARLPARDPAKGPKRRRTPDNPSPSGSKPTEEW